MKKWMKRAWRIVLSFLAACAPGMNLGVQRKLRPDAFELGGYVYQIIGRTFNAITTDWITLAIMAGAVL